MADRGAVYRNRGAGSPSIFLGRTSHRTGRLGFLLPMLLAALLAAGCGKSGTPATQVAARVNSDEISVHQVNAVLSAAKGIPSDNAGKAKREILDKLIDQRLAVQQAMDRHLDRTPAVMQLLEAARAEVLSRAYREQIAGSLSKPSADEARKFYAAHPELFSRRRIYNVQEIVLAPDAKALADIRQMLAQRRSMHEIAAALKENQVRFEANAAIRPAEQIPLELLSKYNELKDGQTALIETPQAAVVVFLAASQSQPVDMAVAVPQIQNYLAGKQAEDAIDREMKRLRAQAKIELFGEFASASTASGASRGAGAEKSADLLR